MAKFKSRRSRSSDESSPRKQGGARRSTKIDKYRKKSSSLFSGAKERAEAEGAGLVGLEDGFYIAAMTKAEIGESKSSGRVQVMFEWTVVEGEMRGDSHREYQGIDDEDQLVYLQKRLMRLGRDPVDDLDELEEVLKAFVEDPPICRIQVNTRNDFTNLYIKKVLDDAEFDPDMVKKKTDADANDKESTSKTSRKTKRRRRSRR